MNILSLHVLLGPALSKHNVLFGGKKDGYCCPKWTAAQLPQVCALSLMYTMSQKYIFNNSSEMN